MGSGTWAQGAFWSLAALGVGGLLVRLDTDSRGARSPAPPRSAPAPAPAVEELRAPALTVAAPLAFAWPPAGRVRVHAEHEEGWTTRAETFELEWRTQADGSVFVEAFAPLDAAPAPPGTTHTGGTLCTPVQAVIAADGRFLRTPAFDDLRRAWDRASPHPVGLAVPEPLAACWMDWVERWRGVALLAGEQTIFSEGSDGEFAWLRCTARDMAGTRLEYRCTRQPRRFVAGQPDSVELVWPSAEREEVMLTYEHGVEVELADGLRPRSVATRESWTWQRSASEVVRTVERVSRYAFDWSPPALALPPEAEASAPPAWFETWDRMRWPALDEEQRSADVAWWRRLWPVLGPRRRALLLADARVPQRDATLRTWRDLGLGGKECLGRLWRQEDPPAQLRVRTWLESGPPEGCVDVLLVGEGYTSEDLEPDGPYWSDVERVARTLFADAPLCWYRDWFNVRAAFLPSAERGCDGDPRHDDVRTALDACFPEYPRRYIEIRDPAPLLELARTIAEPDVVLVLVNAERCAGSGNSVTRSWKLPARLPTPIFSMGCSDSEHVAVHEFGHGLADLADEYVDDTFPLGVFGGPNVSASAESGPWNHFLELPGAPGASWFHEGANYRARGAYRPWPICRMNDAADPFCPVCCEALARAIYRTCDLAWDDGAYHRAHPLARWPR